MIRATRIAKNRILKRRPSVHCFPIVTLLTVLGTLFGSPFCKSRRMPALNQGADVPSINYTFRRPVGFPVLLLVNVLNTPAVPQNTNYLYKGFIMRKILSALIATAFAVVTVSAIAAADATAPSTPPQPEGGTNPRASAPAASVQTESTKKAKTTKVAAPKAAGAAAASAAGAPIVAAPAAR